jgi:hypothetical protein
VRAFFLRCVKFFFVAWDAIIACVYFSHHSSISAPDVTPLPRAQSAGLAPYPTPAKAHNSESFKKAHWALVTSTGNAFHISWRNDCCILLIFAVFNAGDVAFSRVHLVVPSLSLLEPSATCIHPISRVGHNHIYTVYIRHFSQKFHQIHGHIRRIHTVLANPTHKTFSALAACNGWLFYIIAGKSAAHNLASCCELAFHH